MPSYELERACRDEGYAVVCGVDEAGAGPLAGPVYAAAVILPREIDIPGLNDSKKLTDKRRRALYDVIIENAVAYGIAMVHEQEIDESNILQARLLAMRRAVELLDIRPDHALVDGNRDPNLPDIPSLLIVGGDGKSASIGVLYLYI
mgnify:CR=1 FL=1